MPCAQRQEIRRRPARDGKRSLTLPMTMHNPSRRGRPAAHKGSAEAAWSRGMTGTALAQSIGSSTRERHEHGAIAQARSQVEVPKIP